MDMHMRDLLPKSWWDVAACVDQYAQTRHQGLPDLRQLVADITPENQTAALVELAAVDIETRWDVGQPKTIERYLEEFPEILDDPNYLEDLIGQEYLVRRDSGE